MMQMINAVLVTVRNIFAIFGNNSYFFMRTRGNLRLLLPVIFKRWGRVVITWNIIYLQLRTEKLHVLFVPPPVTIDSRNVLLKVRLIYNLVNLNRLVVCNQQFQSCAAFCNLVCVFFEIGICQDFLDGLMLNLFNDNFVMNSRQQNKFIYGDVNAEIEFLSQN